jgi:hypothetical protein
MPWKASDKLPPAAEKLKGHARDVFVAAANAALKEYDGDEGRAIATGLAAAKNAKDNLKKAEYTRNSDGTIEYRGEKFPGFGKPKKDSGDKQGAVLVKRGDEVKIVRFGDPSLSDNTSVEANNAFYARFGGQEGINDPFSPLYWSARWLWPRGKMKGKGPKEFFSVNKSVKIDMDVEDLIEDGHSGFLHDLVSLFERWFGSPSDQGGDNYEIEMMKSVDSEQRRALFVVLEPNIIDLHGDTYSEEEVEKACISFNTHSMKANLFHKVETEKAKIEQSFITPASFTLDDGREIVKGTWLQWWSFPENDPISEQLWSLVKSGEINGVSIGARARVENIE